MKRTNDVLEFPPTSASGELTATFMGVTTILLGDGETSLMTDGFFSRPSKWQLLTQRIEPNGVRIRSVLAKLGVNNIAALLVAHSHHDHALDSATVALQTGAQLIGSSSVGNIARGEGFPEDLIREIRPDSKYAFGSFVVIPFRSPHSPHGFFRGTIHPPFRAPARVKAYRGGFNYSFLVSHRGRNILIHPSANFALGMFRDVRADVVFLGVGTLGKRTKEFSSDYWREVVQVTGARLVIPVHWDDFTLSLERPLEPMPSLVDNFDRGMDRVMQMALRDRVTVKFMPIFQPVSMTQALSSLPP